MFDMASKGEKINLSRYMMDKMLLTLKEKETDAKKKSTPQVTAPYMTVITHYVKSLGSWNSKYELIPIAVTYKLGSIAKMGYKDPNKDGKYMKVYGVQDDDEEKAAPTDAQVEG